MVKKKLIISTVWLDKVSSVLLFHSICSFCISTHNSSRTIFCCCMTTPYLQKALIQSNKSRRYVCGLHRRSLQHANRNHLPLEQDGLSSTSNSPAFKASSINLSGGGERCPRFPRVVMTNLELLDLNTEAEVTEGRDKPDSLVKQLRERRRSKENQDQTHSELWLCSHFHCCFSFFQPPLELLSLFQLL